MSEYRYFAKPDEVKPAYDGDSLYLWVDLGFYTWKKMKFRLLGIDTPELRGTEEEKQYGREARDFVIAILKQNEELTIDSVKKTKFDYGAHVYISYDENGRTFPFDKPVSLADYLIEQGHGVSYDGGTKQTWEERKAIQDEVRALLS